jgi:hypothetical protein
VTTSSGTRHRSPVEAEAFAAVYAYQFFLTCRAGRKTRATGIWQAIKRYGIIEAVQQAVSRPLYGEGQVTLAELGLGDLAFEAVVVRNEMSFSDAAIDASKARLDNSDVAGYSGSSF